MIRAASDVTLAGDALMTMAFPAGTPSDLAVESETTASTPPMPTVPNATTGSRCCVRPAAVTVAAQRELVQGAHGVGDRDAAVGHALPQRARGRRGPGGVTAEGGRVDAEHGRIRPVDLDLGRFERLGAGDPGCRDTAARTCPESENGATTSRSACRSPRSGATCADGADLVLAAAEILASRVARTAIGFPRPSVFPPSGGTTGPRLVAESSPKRAWTVGRPTAEPLTGPACRPPWPAPHPPRSRAPPAR